MCIRDSYYSTHTTEMKFYHTHNRKTVKKISSEVNIRGGVISPVSLSVGPCLQNMHIKEEKERVTRTDVMGHGNMRKFVF